MTSPAREGSSYGTTFRVARPSSDLPHPHRRRHVDTFNDWGLCWAQVVRIQATGLSGPPVIAGEGLVVKEGDRGLSEATRTEWPYGALEWLV
jgi:hypothetical protein